MSGWPNGRANLYDNANGKAEFVRTAALTRNTRERELLLDRAASCVAL
jgi:hypothetical protein